MGKRYFCDYCQRSFVDDIESRKQHLNGVSHIRMKKEYYAMNRDLKTLIKEEKAKESCRRFQNTGECSFGLLCNYTHYTPEELENFERTVQLQEEEKSRIPSIEQWVATRAVKSYEGRPSEVRADGWTTLLDPSLPPSLRLPSLDSISSFAASNWG